MSLEVTGQGEILMVFNLNNGETEPRIQKAESESAAQTILTNHLQTSPNMEVVFVGKLSTEYQVTKYTEFNLTDINQQS